MKIIMALLLCAGCLSGCQTDETSSGGSFTSCQSIGDGGTADVICP